MCGIKKSLWRFFLEFLISILEIRPPFVFPNRRLFVKRFRGLRTLGSWLKRSRLSGRSVVLVCCLSKMVQYTVSNRLLYYQSWAHITIAINNNKHYKIIPMFCMAKKYGGTRHVRRPVVANTALNDRAHPILMAPPNYHFHLRVHFHLCYCYFIYLT